MDILVTIPHFFNPQGTGKHASLRQNPTPKIRALSAAITALQQIVGKNQCAINIRDCLTVPVNQVSNNQLDIVICTVGEYHLLDQLPIPQTLYQQHKVEVEPMLLGFECQAILQANLGKYDYYCFLEDDLILHDAWFFKKINWFNQIDSRNLLQPNRYEISGQGIMHKAYIDGDMRARATANFQDIREKYQITGKVMGNEVLFRRCLNPHSGCYFLNAEQMAYWAKQAHFLDRDTSFISPLESAATLGIMKTFRIYKPVPENANFLEIQHAGTAFLSLIGNQVKLG